MADESQNPPNPQQTPTDESASGRNWTDIAIPVIMMVIIIVLAALWFIERRQRIDVNQQLNECMAEREKEKGSLSGIFAKIMQSAPQVTTQVAQTVATPSIDKKNLPTEKVVVGQKETTAWRVNKADGEKLGLSPGDVIVVGQ